MAASRRQQEEEEEGDGAGGVSDGVEIMAMTHHHQQQHHRPPTCHRGMIQVCLLATILIGANYSLLPSMITHPMPSYSSSSSSSSSLLQSIPSSSSSSILSKEEGKDDRLASVVDQEIVGRGNDRPRNITNTTITTGVDTTTTTTADAAAATAAIIANRTKRRHERYVSYQTFMKESKPWKDENTHVKVSPEEYKQTIQTAHTALEPLVQGVHTDCYIILLPGKETSESLESNQTSSTGQRRRDRNTLKGIVPVNGNNRMEQIFHMSSTNVQMKFQCHSMPRWVLPDSDGIGSGDVGTDKVPHNDHHHLDQFSPWWNDDEQHSSSSSLLQDEPCQPTGANLCLVLTSQNGWWRMIDTDNVNSTTTTTTDNGNVTTTEETNRQPFLQSPYGSSIYTNTNTTNTATRHNKSAVLMMVDTVSYLQRDWIWLSFLNQASYSIQSHRPFFVFLGNVPQDVLNSRPDEDNNIDDNDGTSIFHAPCAVKQDWNTMHYYKPIAFATLFHKQTLVTNIQTVLFMDADAAFHDTAFERISTTSPTERQPITTLVDSKSTAAIGPEDYFDLSSQASLLGWQNVRGGNIMNGGLLGLRNTTWLHDFSALWWHTRCGHKDQRGLWLVLFATWSAHTGVMSSSSMTTSLAATDVTNSSTKDSVIASDDVTQFAFPASIFGDYDYAKRIAIGVFANKVGQIQSSWTRLASHGDGDVVDGRWKSSSLSTLEIPQPTNVTLYNGGRRHGNRPFTTPIELPHVMIMPLAAWVHHRSDGTKVQLPSFKEDVQDKNRPPFVIHSKRYESVCDMNKCWPFVVP